MDELSGRTGFEVQATEGIHPEAVWLSLRSAGGLCIEAARRGGGVSCRRAPSVGLHPVTCEGLEREDSPRPRHRGSHRRTTAMPLRRRC